MRRRIRSAAGFGALALLAVWAAACSSSDGSAADAGPNEETTTAPPADAATETAGDDAPRPADVTSPDVPERECTLSAACAERVGPLGPCEAAVCLPGSGICATEPLNDGTSCDDGDACTTDDQCLTGRCGPGDASTCDDDNPCTRDSCDGATGCSNAPTTEACDDGNPCTVGDACDAGACVPGGNDCACETDADCAQYEDDDLCNGTLFCANDALPATCEVDLATVVLCAPGRAPTCQQSACDPGTGACEFVALDDGIVCDDGDACTRSDACESGACAGGGRLPCDDGSDCTDDRCDAAMGCVFEDNGSCGPCDGIGCLPCGTGAACADEGPFVGDTCCARGDALVYLGRGTASEAVDVEADDRFAYLCGGFGVRINDITTPQSPTMVGSATRRCQRIGLGPHLDGGIRVMYLAHHGDSWVDTPFLKTFHLSDAGQPTEIHSIADSEVLFEGMAWHEGCLYVAAHGGGLRVYETGAQGEPELKTVLEGFTNAWKVDVEGAHAYVADAEGGLRVVSIATPNAPSIVQSLPTTGTARDVDATSTRVFVALGADGVDVFERGADGLLGFSHRFLSDGSVQAVSADGPLLAVAAWSHVELRDAATDELLGTEDVRLYPRFDQVLGVALRGDLLFVDEWEGLHVVQYRQGRVGPDIFIQEELLDFDGSTEGARAVIVRNRGVLDLEITGVRVDDPDRFSVDRTTLSIAPGGAGVIEVTHTPPPGGGGGSIESRIVLDTNDPDAGQNPYQLFLIAGNSTLLEVGDTVGAEFAIFDPTGSGQLENLRGRVVILGYFALF